jgi:hypothetical protein
MKELETSNPVQVPLSRETQRQPKNQEPVH